MTEDKQRDAECAHDCGKKPDFGVFRGCKPEGEYFSNCFEE